MSGDESSSGNSNSGNGGGKRPQGGRRRGSGSGGGGSQRNRPGARPGSGGPANRRGGDRRQGGPAPIEIAVRSTRNAIKRHAESLRDDQARLACRSIVTGLLGVGKGSSSPAEVLGVVEQVGHVLEAGRRDDAQLPIALRAVVNFALESPRRQRDAAEMLRLLLRHSYLLAADHIPRQLRDDGNFRATSLLQVYEECGPEYLADEKFAKLMK